MPNYGFAIDLRKCIGCHACTIACKAEHDIPIGVNRCWVKTVEQGTFPATRRLFFPVLCNQCDNAPCARICPTNALYRRRDGIVDLHGDACIGCRIFGDLDNPVSEVARIAKSQASAVRKPEKGTTPKVFYLGAEESAIQPELATRPFLFKEGQVLLRPLASPAPDPS